MAHSAGEIFDRRALSILKHPLRHRAPRTPRGPPCRAGRRGRYQSDNRRRGMAVFHRGLDDDDGVADIGQAPKGADEAVVVRADAGRLSARRGHKQTPTRARSRLE